LVADRHVLKANVGEPSQLLAKVSEHHRPVICCAARKLQIGSVGCESGDILGAQSSDPKVDLALAFHVIIVIEIFKSG